jgi:hypothetical protein
VRPPRLSAPKSGDVDPLKFDEEPSQEKGQDDLREVEHALSALAGRHPEHARLEREDIARADRRRRELARAVVRERTTRRMRSAKRLLFLAALAGVGIVIRAHVLQISEARGLVDDTAKKFTAVGFGAFPDGWLSANHADAAIGAGTCVVAVAANVRGEADLEVDRDGVTTRGHGSVGFCTCAAEHITVATRNGGAARILHREANDFGGTLGFTLKNAHPSTLLDSPCAEEQLDAYVATHADGAASSQRNPLDDLYAPFSEAGFRPFVSEPSAAPFVVVSAAPEMCFLANAKTPSETISLRLTGGTRPIQEAPGGVAWCTAKGGLFTIWRRGTSPIQVASSAALRAGGLYGVREIREQSHTNVTTWLAPADLPWDATQALRASGIVELATLDAESAAKMPIPSTRIVAVSILESATISPDAGQDTIFFACAPQLEKSESAICVEGAAQRWRALTPRGSWGAASSALPFWMAGYAQVRDPAVVPSQLSLLTLARKLIRRGFEPTVLAGVKELDHGAEVLGRAGEDSVVAVGIAPEAPWLVPYTDGAAWSIDDEPRVVPLAPGTRIALTPAKTATPLHSGLDARRTIVFRHGLEKK